MSAGDFVLIGWLVGGVIFGLLAANEVWKDPPVTSGSPGLDAFTVFVGAVVAAPLVAAAAAVAGLAWCGAWLLPAFRERKRAERTEREQSTAEAQQAAVDRLHHELGLPPVDWEGRP
jgi:membrane associated rhomboid family serine protease